MRYIVVTDLDGTLLDHKTYDFTPALATIQKLQTLNIPLILNSSKTQSEISTLRQQLENNHPFICENGGIICGIGETKYLATPRQEFLPIIADLKQKLNLKFTGFAEATIKEVVEWTGLTISGATRAMERNATEPLFWQDGELALDNFRRELNQLGLQCVKGGRFHHIMGMFNKASCFNQLKNYYSQLWQEDVGIVALGDSPNDLPMLENADFSIVIPSAKGGVLQPRQSAIYYAQQPAPYGWPEGINCFLQTILPE